MTAPALVKNIAKTKWISRWAGSYTFISCSYWGPQYYHSLKKHLGVHFNHTLFIHRKGVVSFFIPERELRDLGKHLAKKSEHSQLFAKKYCDELKKNTDILSPIMEKLRNKIPTPAEYRKFNEVFDRHLAFHVFVKKTIDFLSVEGLKRLLSYFQNARLYSEKIYSDSESFFRGVMRAIAKKEKYNADYLTCLTQEEFETYLRERTLPAEKILKSRYQASALYFEKAKSYLLLGKEVDEVEKIITRQAAASKHEIKGISAYPGRVVGKVRIVLDPFKVKVFNQGDILVTGMTRPEFMPYVRKAAAIVTDVGGVLSHAAIVAREMRIPCIVGTGVATKIFKDGQKVMVDAHKSLVKKL